MLHKDLAVKPKEKRQGLLVKLLLLAFFQQNLLDAMEMVEPYLTMKRLIIHSRDLLEFHGDASDKYENVRIGINGRLDTIQAAILLEKLSIFNDELILRNKVANYYSNNISLTLINLLFQKVICLHGHNILYWLVQNQREMK